MSTFSIYTQDGLIPASRLIRIIPTSKAGGARSPQRVEYATEQNQTAITEAIAPAHEVDFLPVIPASPGYELIVAHKDPDAIDGVSVERIPIVAWRIEGQSALPVTPLEAPCPDPAILTPAGEVFADDQWFSDIELFKRLEAR